MFVSIFGIYFPILRTKNISILKAKLFGFLLYKLIISQYILPNFSCQMKMYNKYLLFISLFQMHSTKI